MVRTPPRAFAHAWPLVGGLAVVAGLSALDAVWGREQTIAATVVIGPFLTALRGSVRQTAIVGAVAVAAVVASAGWNHNLGTSAYPLRALVVVAGSVFALLAARARIRLAVERRRFRLLSAAAAIGERDHTVEEAIAEVRALVVPAVADTCTVDLAPAGRADAAAGATPDGRAIVLPLRARDADVGVLRLEHAENSPRRYDAGDVAFARVLAGRVALALDNAGLFSALQSLEARQTAALGSLVEAVTIQDAGGRLVYANDAAARALGFASPDALLATPPERIVDAFESVTEDGQPVRLEDLPGRRVLSGLPAEPLLVRARHRVTGEERWRLVKATAVRDRDGAPRLAVNVIEDVTDVKRAELAQRFLAEAGVLLSSSLDHEETLQRVARLAVPQLADWCTVSLPDERGYLRSVAIAHTDPEKERIAREYDERFAPRVGADGGEAQVMLDGVSLLVNELSDALLAEAISDPEQLGLLRSLQLHAVMTVPLVAARGVIGVLTFVSAESGRRFTESDLELAEELGRRAGTAVDNARLHTERSHIARTLQLGLLPDALPDIPGFQIASLYRPAGEENFVGGDFYDAFGTPAGWMVVVGDVTGRGAEAAALTGQARHTLRTAGVLLGDPAAAVAELNRALTARRDLPVCTVAVVLLAGDEARIVCAGHPPPLLLRDGTVEPVGAIGPMVGAWDDAAWAAATVPLAPGDVLVLYTDGVTDARGRVGRFGEERLAAALRGTTQAEEAVARVREALTGFERGGQADDTAIVAVERRPTAVEAAAG